MKAADQSLRSLERTSATSSGETKTPHCSSRHLASALLDPKSRKQFITKSTSWRRWSSFTVLESSSLHASSDLGFKEKGLGIRANMGFFMGEMIRLEKWIVLLVVGLGFGRRRGG